jgi:hypothetical protein
MASTSLYNNSNLDYTGPSNNNPYGLIQKAGKRKSRKNKSRKNKTRKTKAHASRKKSVFSSFMKIFY